jgi:hypothetical protein
MGEILDGFGVNGLVFLKLAIIIGMVLYVVFAFIILKQVKLMTDTLELGFEKPIKMFAKLHLLIAALILAFSLFI